MIKYTHQGDEIMNKLQFILKTNHETIIDTEVNYYQKDEIIHFKYANDLYEYDIKNAILKKTNKESSILIDFKQEKITITLLEYQSSFDMDITDIKRKNNASSIELEYTFQSDEKTTNWILIKY